jgi:hypothetical protein
MRNSRRRAAEMENVTVLWLDVGRQTGIIPRCLESQQTRRATTHQNYDYAILHFWEWYEGAATLYEVISCSPMDTRSDIEAVYQRRPWLVPFIF